MFKPIINHTFKVDYIKPTKQFEWTAKNPIVGYDSYRERIMPKISDIVYELYLNPNSRQAVINVNESHAHMSCLMNYQFQIVDDTFHVTANYRSMCSKHGLPNDIELVRYVVLLFKHSPIYKLMYRDLKVEITFNVGNYHMNPLGDI